MIKIEEKWNENMLFKWIKREMKKIWKYHLFECMEKSLKRIHEL